MVEKKIRYRSIFISDLHLGSPHSQAERLLDFLKHHDSDYLYLVGDIIDGWQLKSSWYWKQSFNDVIQKILRKARKGTNVIYIPGNHDEFLRPFAHLSLGGVKLKSQVIHEAADGQRYLVMHGDQFDSVIQNAKWLARLGDHAYGVALHVNRWVNRIRPLCGFSYWSLSSYLKQKVKNAVQFISLYEETLAEAAKSHKVDGVICGHIHKGEIRRVGPVWYLNTGDWVESCTALVEDTKGNFSLLTWTNQAASEEPEMRTDFKQHPFTLQEEST